MSSVLGGVWFCVCVFPSFLALSGFQLNQPWKLFELFGEGSSCLPGNLLCRVFLSERLLELSHLFS